MSSWKNVNALPAVSANLGLVAFKHWLFAIGGASQLSNPSTFQGVLRASVDSNDGSIGPWLPAVASSSSAVLPDNKFGPAVKFLSPHTLVVAGGAPAVSGSLGPTGAQLSGGAEVMTSQVDQDGNLSPWVIQSMLPINVVDAALLFSQGWMFVVGGQQLQVSLPYSTQHAQVALPYDGGIVGGPFVQGETVTGGTSGATLVLNAGASAASGVLTGNVLVGVFVDDETLTGGTSGAVTTANISGPLVSTTFAAGDVVTGGTSGAKLTITAAAAGGAGTLVGVVMSGGPFVNGETLRASPSGSTAVVNSASGGSITTVANQNVYKARLGADRSIIGSWQVVGTLPAGVIGITSNNVVGWRNEFIYLFDQGTLWKARVNRDGDFMSVSLPASFGGNGSWSPMNGPATANATLQSHMMTLINQNELMIVGGNDGAGNSQFGVFSAHLDGDGNISGNWVETASLLTAVDSAGIVTASNNLVFVVGGSSSTVVQSAVQVARYGASGRIGGV